MRYELFVLQLKMLKAYEESKEDIEREIDDIVYQFCGVKGVRFDKEPAQFNQYLSQEAFWEMSERLKEPEKELDFTIMAINRMKPIVEENISKLPELTQKAVKLLFFENKTYEEVGKIIGYSDHGIWQKVRRDVENI